MIAPTERIDVQQATVHGLIEAQAAERPESTALRTRERSLTYGEFNSHANALAWEIHRAASARSFIAAFLDDGLESVVAMQAISKAGCVRVPIDTRLPTSGVLAILRQVDVSAFVVDEANVETLRALDYGKPIIVIKPLTDDVPTAANLDLEIGGEDPYLLAFTSGSSGIPKGMLNTHKDYTVYARHSPEAYFRQDDRVLRFGAMSSAGGSSPMRRTLMVGGVVDILELSRETPESIFQWIVEKQVTLLNMMPSLFRTIFSTPPEPPISTVRMLRMGTEPVLEVDFQLFKRSFTPGTHIMNSYGATEVGHITAFVGDHSTQIDGPIVPVGMPAPDTEVFVADENRNPLPAGEIGEIIIRTNQKQSSYWNSPQQSEGKFIVDPADSEYHFYRTGDLGRILPDGNLIHLGRADSMVKIRGFRVELAFIENRLRQHPDVDSAVVKAISDEQTARIVAYVVARGGITLSIPQVRSFLSDALPDFMMPAQFIVMDKLPRLANGKINPAELPPPTLETTQNETLTLTESRLYPLFRNVLPSANIRRDDNFFDIGGDSLKVMRLVSDLKARFGLTVTPALIYSHPTLAQLAAYVDQGSPTLSPLIALNPYGTQPVIVGIPGARGNAMLFRELTMELGHDYPVYAFQFPGYDEKSPKFYDMQTFARYFIDLVASTVKAERYYLIGGSVGGVIAFEMAQQLTAMGKPPLGLIMVDTYVNRGSREAYEFEIEMEAALEPAETNPAAVTGPVQKAYKLYRKVRGKFMNFFFPSEEVRAIKRMKRETRRITRHYVAQTYAGKIIYLTCRTARQRVNEPERHEHLAWEKLAQGGLELLDTPGDHEHALAQPYVRDVARQMRRIIGEGSEKQ